MNENLDMICQNNAAWGHPENEINIAVDGRYNSSTISSRKNPRKNASLCILLAVEQNTDKQYVVAAVVQNKLCWTGAWLKHKGFAVTYPGGHADCTANQTNIHSKDKRLTQYYPCVRNISYGKWTDLRIKDLKQAKTF